jgi:16S rRNA (cytidine1402-2'-O)-methyltransferase
LKQTLSELEKSVGGGRSIALCRELTKVYEDIWRGSLEDAIAYYKEATPKGEYVIVVSGRSQDEIEAEKTKRWENISLQDHLQQYLSKGLSRKEAMKMMASDRGCNKREIYQLLLEED